MKINPQLPQPCASYLTAHPSDNFADWLSSPAHDTNGDEYYRLHQHHLQQSALSFTAITTEPNQKHVIDEPSPPITDNPTHSARLDNSSVSAIKPQTASQSAIDGKTVRDTAPVMSEQLLALKTIITAYLADLDKPITAPDISPRANTAVSDKGLQHRRAITPSYQLFLNGNNAELALNTQQMSKPDADDLHTLIKQALAAKGYRLGKLIINGVTQ